ncbi:MAG TPA: hypothetical protein DCZ30_06110 [Clostridiales bacterium]|nr:hypothetical protein [Clostridiales bacterium]
MIDTIQKIYINIKNFFTSIFKKKNLMLEEPKAENKIKNSSELNNIEKLRKESENRQKVKEIIDITENNPELLENLSIKQLQVIDSYYDESLEEINKKIADFRAKLNK